MFAGICVESQVIDGINTAVARQRRLGLYLPTVVAIPEDERGRILLVKSVKAGTWGFPQGGVENAEEVIAALLRELEEEVNLVPPGIEVRAFCLTQCLDVPIHGRGGFLLGKQYHYFHVRCRSPRIVLQREEVSDYRWLSRGEAREAIEHLYRPGDRRYRKKKQGMLTALSMLSGARVAPLS